MKLKIGTGLSLPLEAVTETFAILGRRGSGKTHTAVVMAEEMLQAGVPVVVLDPLDVWWGLRVSKDGKAAGFPIYVAGGSHADIPLLPDAGKVIADAVVDKGLSIVLSVRHLSKADQRRFVGEFCERLYDRKADPKHRTALHVFIDEADAFVPQRLLPGGERCYGAVDTMVRRGRSSGLAITLISQRPQVIAKDVLSQTEVLVAHQLTGPQDRKALDAWVEANDTEDRRGEFMGSLASLPNGTAWFWSPGLLGIFKRVEVRDRHTFDSSATPKAGVSAVASPKAFAAVDLLALTAEIAATIAKAKADNPAELKKEIAALKREIDTLKKAPAAKAGVVEKSVLTEKDRQVLSAWTERMREQSAALTADLDRVVEQVRMKVAAAVNVASCDMVTLLSASEEQAVRPLETVQVQRVLDKLAALAPPAPVANQRVAGIAPRQTHARVEPRRQPPSAPRHSANGNGDLSRAAERKVLTVLAQYPQGRTIRQVAILAGYAMNGGGFRNAVGRLRSLGYLEGKHDGLVITDAGTGALGSWEPLPTGSALASHWLSQLDRKAEREVLQVLLDAYPVSLTADQIATKTPTQYEAGGGGFRNALGKLKTLELVDAERGLYTASAELF